MALIPLKTTVRCSGCLPLVGRGEGTVVVVEEEGLGEEEEGEGVGVDTRSLYSTVSVTGPRVFIGHVVGGEVFLLLLV